MCGSHLSGVTKKRRVMSDELIQKIRTQVLGGAQDLSLTVAGEPLMTPKISTFLSLAEESGAALQINSNATLMRDNETLRRLLSGASVIKFSVDGARRATYESIRVGSDFELVLKNIRMVVQIRNELPRAIRPRLAVCMVMMRRNIGELVEMVDLVHELGVDRLELAHLTVLDEALDAESLRHFPGLCDEHLASARKRADQLGLRLHMPPTMNGKSLPAGKRAELRLAWREVKELNRARLHRLKNQALSRLQEIRWSQKAGGRVPCHFLQHGVFISIGGDVAPCPMPGRPVAGNLLEQRFDEIWNGPVLTNMRRKLLSGDPMDCCKHCSQNPSGFDPMDEKTLNPGSVSLQ